MRMLLILVPIILVLTGCTGNTRSEPIEVKVPVSDCPTPKEVLRPALPIDNLKAGDEADPGKVAVAYAATVKALLGYARELEQILDGYRKVPTPAPPAK